MGILKYYVFNLDKFKTMTNKHKALWFYFILFISFREHETQIMQIIIEIPTQAEFSLRFLRVSNVRIFGRNLVWFKPLKKKFSKNYYENWSWEI